MFFRLNASATLFALPGLQELDLMLECEKGVHEQDVFVNSRMSCGHSHETTVRSYQEPINWLTHGQGFAQVICLLLKMFRAVLSWGSFSTCGRRETMEDTHFIAPNFCNEKDIHFFYGHRGAAAAQFSAGALPEFLRTQISASSPSKVLVEAFVRINIVFRNELNSQSKYKGVISKYFNPGCRLFVANAGDCKVILCRVRNPYALTR